MLQGSNAAVDKRLREPPISLYQQERQGAVTRDEQEEETCSEGEQDMQTAHSDSLSQSQMQLREDFNSGVTRGYTRLKGEWGAWLGMADSPKLIQWCPPRGSEQKAWAGVFETLVEGCEGYLRM